MNNPNLPDNCQSLTDKNLPWNIDECDACGDEIVPNEDGICECEEGY